MYIIYIIYIIIYLDTVYPLYSGNLRQAASDPVEHGYKGTPDISSKLGKALLQDRSDRSTMGSHHAILSGPRGAGISERHQL